MMISKRHLPFLLLAGIGFAPTSSASLVSELNGQVVYDTDRNITWMADANLAATNTFGVGGIDANGNMGWYTAQSWITALNSANYLGYNDWRLPSTLVPDASCTEQQPGTFAFGYSCTGSEWGHLFYQELGATAGSSILTGNATELAKFSNIQSSLYWSGTDVYPSEIGAPAFRTYDGYQSLEDKRGGPYGPGRPEFAWAVRSGNVVTTTSAVPEPGMILLLAAGIAGWSVARSKRCG